MAAITDIGQAEIKLVGHTYFLNPSFLAMTRIGTPEEVVTAMVHVHGGHYPQHEIRNELLLRDTRAVCFARMVKAAALIVQSCCEEDISHLVGGYAYTPRGKLVMKKGFMPLEDVLTLARHLIKHGVMGDQDNEDVAKDGEYTNRFDARSFVYLAVAHLGMSENEAWNMTMTSFRAAMEAKYPPPPKAKIPSQKKYEEAMDWADQLMQRDNNRKY